MITAYCLNSWIRRALTHVIHIVQCVMKCFFFVNMKSINDWNGAIFKAAKPAWEKSLSFLAVVSSFYIIFASARWPNAYFIIVWSTFVDWNGLKPETRFVLRDRIIAGLLTSSWLELHLLQFYQEKLLYERFEVPTKWFIASRETGHTTVHVPAFTGRFMFQWRSFYQCWSSTSRNYNDVRFICKNTFVASAVNEKAISSASRLVSIFCKLFRFCKSSL